ncbi:hypothetical protein CAPTEDRAFT_226859 [Capitella teleta]|uniref:RRM domain-containing protein n=1 Tax=Capitella teleta TaxID=283909 RepID=R7U7V0_CAPTE|nr:hypothetical protein CAPTEDRAFT_226859 [Capitella teleta]|eukprot:ELT99751.1 hypothetical protein CAPTEDRAFT_226859 [Capitella teleta]
MSFDENGGGDDRDEGFIVRIRGLPWSASHDEVANFLEADVNIMGGRSGIHLTYTKDGRPSGEAYIELASEEDVAKALEKDKHHMGRRYIEGMQSSLYLIYNHVDLEMEWMVKRSGPNQVMGNNDAVIRLRGLPFGCSKEEVAHFFSGLEIVPNGITLMQDGQGRSTGDAFVQFASQDIAERAQQKHKEKIGHRYIEIFKSSLQELRNSMVPKMMGGRGGGMGGNMGRPGPYDRMDRMGGGGGGGMGRGGGRFGPGGGKGGMDNYESTTGHSVHMRGLPFQAAEDDIVEFFKPLAPVNIAIHYMPDGKASGQADVDFATHQEASEAMSRDRESMEHRYIELFLKSSEGYKGPGGRGGFEHNSFGTGNSGGMGGGGRGNFNVNNMGTNYTAF